MVYLVKNNPDGHHHCVEDVIAEVLEDSRRRDRMRDGLTILLDETLDGIVDIWFRHSDLAPHEDGSTNQN